MSDLLRCALESASEQYRATFRQSLVREMARRETSRPSANEIVRDLQTCCGYRNPHHLRVLAFSHQRGRFCVWTDNGTRGRAWREVAAVSEEVMMEARISPSQLARACGLDVVIFNAADWDLFCARLQLVGVCFDDGRLVPVSETDIDLGREPDPAYAERLSGDWLAARNERVNAKNAEVYQKSNAWLLEFMTDSQRASWRADGYFTVRGSHSGGRYDILSKYAYNVRRYASDDVTLLARLCTQAASGEFPQADVWLAQKLLIETDEREFLRIANHRLESASDERPRRESHPS